MTTWMIDKANWRPYLDTLSKHLDDRRAEVKVVSPKIGSQTQAEWVRLLGVTYDPKDDILEIALEGLDHLIRKPLELHGQEGAVGLETLSVLDADGNRHIIQLRDPLVLGPDARKGPTT